MAIPNRIFSAILFFVIRFLFLLLAAESRCGISGDSRPAIVGIVRFAIRDSVPLRSLLFLNSSSFFMGEHFFSLRETSPNFPSEGNFGPERC